MVEKEAGGSEGTAFPSVMFPELAKMGNKRVEEFVSMQSDLFEQLQRRNRQWFERAQTEANLSSEFTMKLTSARSIPDAVTACQEYGARRFELMAEDGNHLLGDTQEFMGTVGRLLSNGWLSNTTRTTP